VISLRLCVDRYDGRQAGTQNLSRRLIRVQSDLYGNTLNDFGEVAGRIVGRDQGKLRSACGRNLGYLAMEDLARIAVDSNLGWITDADILQLRFFEIRLDP